MYFVIVFNFLQFFKVLGLASSGERRHGLARFDNSLRNAARPCVAVRFHYTCDLFIH